MISSSQRPLPDNTRHSQQTNIHAPGGIRTQDLSRWAACGRSPRIRTGGRMLGDTVMDIRVSYIVRNFLNNSETVSFWRRTLLREVSWYLDISCQIIYIFFSHLSLLECFSTAGPRPGTGPWHQLYRAARGSPGICHFSFLSIFYELVYSGSILRRIIFLNVSKSYHITIFCKISLVQWLITDLNVILYLSTCHTVHISVLILFVIVP